MTRKGEVAYVVVGDSKYIWIPALSRGRLGAGRLKGLRCIHTHLNGEPLSREDVTDLVLIGLDLMVCVQVNEKGIPVFIEVNIMGQGLHHHQYYNGPLFGDLTDKIMKL